MNTNSTFSNFEALMTKHSTNIYQVSKATGIPSSTLYSWKSGVSEPKTDTLLKLVAYFDCDLNEILGRNTKSTDTNPDVECLQSEKNCNPIFHNFEQYINERGININNVSKATGIPNSVLYTWKKSGGNIGIDKLITIAKYLKCSLDKLVGLKNESLAPIEDNSSISNNVETDNTIKPIHSETNSVAPVVKPLNHAQMQNLDTSSKRLLSILDLLDETSKNEILNFAEFLLIKRK